MVIYHCQYCYIEFTERDNMLIHESVCRDLTDKERVKYFGMKIQSCGTCNGKGEVNTILNTTRDSCLYINICPTCGGSGEC